MSTSTEMADDILLSIDGLKVCFDGEDGVARAVNGVDLTIKQGETLAIVGESGSGKSVMSLAVMGLLPRPPARVTDGAMRFRRRDGSVIDLRHADERSMRKIRGNEISMIFQEPMTSLNPVYTIGDQIAEVVMLHKRVGRQDAWARAREMLDLVGIPDAARRLGEYPHRLSGGMRQRVMIAMALACNPALIIADEPTTALDVTIQAQILELMQSLQSEFGTSLLFITHNLGVVAGIADRVAVMYSGRIVEEAGKRALFHTPRHPYTRGLLASIPRLTDEGGPQGGGAEGGGRLYAIPGNAPSPLAQPGGCAFADRCAYLNDDCRRSVPEMETAAPDHRLRCFRWRDL